MSLAVKLTPALARSRFIHGHCVKLEVSFLNYSIAPLVSCTDMNNILYVSCILLKALATKDFEYLRSLLEVN